jgi:drug/metabolite transporter (DMT)-like permease
MWQLYSLSAIFSNTLEETIDKATMLGSSVLDTVVAAWIRNIIVFGIALVVAVVSLRAFPQLIFSFPIIWWGFVYAIQAISYTWILKHVEITAASVTFALLPLVFLPIDLFIRHEPLTLLQMGGIFLLVGGGIIFFARRDVTARLSLKRYISMIFIILIFDAIVIGSEGYIFKSYYDAVAINPSTFLVSGMFYMCIFLTLMLLVWYIWMRGRINLTGARAYARGSSVAKLADYGNIFFTLQALTMASVAQVSAMKVLHPLILLGVTMVAQHKMSVELEESFTRKTAIQKGLGIAIIVVGSFLIR